LGQDINGAAAYDTSGWSISLNAAGDRVAIGAPYDDTSGLDAGSVKVYSLSGTTWTQLGTNINGLSAGDYSGWSVALMQLAIE